MKVLCQWHIQQPLAAKVRQGLIRSCWKGKLQAKGILTTTVNTQPQRPQALLRHTNHPRLFSTAQLHLVQIQQEAIISTRQLMGKSPRTRSLLHKSHRKRTGDQLLTRSGKGGTNRARYIDAALLWRNLIIDRDIYLELRYPSRLSHYQDAINDSLNDACSKDRIPGFSISALGNLWVHLNGELARPHIMKSLIFVLFDEVLQTLTREAMWHNPRTYNPFLLAQHDPLSHDCLIWCWPSCIVCCTIEFQVPSSTFRPHHIQAMLHTKVSPYVKVAKSPRIAEMLFTYPLLEH